MGCIITGKSDQCSQTFMLFDIPSFVRCPHNRAPSHRRARTFRDTSRKGDGCKRHTHREAGLRLCLPLRMSMCQYRQVVGTATRMRRAATIRVYIAAMALYRAMVHLVQRTDARRPWLPVQRHRLSAMHMLVGRISGRIWTIHQAVDSGHAADAARLHLSMTARFPDPSLLIHASART